MTFTKIPPAPDSTSLSILPTSSSTSNSSTYSTRREFAQAFLATAAGVLLSSSSPAGASLRSFLSNEPAPNNLVDENSSPSLLNAEQRTALAVLCEAIVPGSKAAHSAPFIELLLSVDTAKAQQEFLASLAALESESQKSFHTRIATLTPAQLRELLSAISAQEHTAHEYFANLKDWSVTAYYSSEIGMRELGWTPDRVFASFPECQHPDGHL